MAKYYQDVPRKYNENVWLTLTYHVGLVPPGFRLWDGALDTPELKEDEEIYCVYCLDEMGAIGGGDESIDYCHNCEQVMEGEPKVILDEAEYQYLIEERLSE